MLVPRVVARLGSVWVIEKVKKVVFLGGRGGTKRLIGIAAIVLLYLPVYLALLLLFCRCAKTALPLQFYFSGPYGSKIVTRSLIAYSSSIDGSPSAFTDSDGRSLAQ